MPFLAVDKEGTELAFTDKKPERWRNEWVLAEDDIGDSYELQPGTIRKLIGKTLTWEDEPYEIPERRTNDDK